MTAPLLLPLGFAPHLVHAPAERVPSPAVARSWGQVALRVERLGSRESLRDLLEPWRAHAALRRLRLPAAGDPEDALGAAGVGLRVDWVLGPEGAVRLRAVSPSRWRRRGVVPWAVPAAVSGPALKETVCLAGTAGWPVELRPEVWVGDAPLLQLLDFYLFHPGLTVPVEPFHSLLIGLLSRRARTLWALWFGAAADCFYLNDAGNVSLCAAWAAQPSRCFGASDDPPEAWRASAPHASLRALLSGESWPDPACGSCQARAVCGGALLSTLPSARCDVFREVMVRLQLAAAALGRRARGTAQSCS